MPKNAGNLAEPQRAVCVCVSVRMTRWNLPTTTTTTTSPDERKERTWQAET